jgi:hypothetical protein
MDLLEAAAEPRSAGQPIAAVPTWSEAPSGEMRLKRWSIRARMACCFGYAYAAKLRSHLYLYCHSWVAAADHAADREIGPSGESEQDEADAV